MLKARMRNIDLLTIFLGLQRLRARRPRPCPQCSRSWLSFVWTADVWLSGEPVGCQSSGILSGASRPYPICTGKIWEGVATQKPLGEAAHG